MPLCNKQINFSVSCKQSKRLVINTMYDSSLILSKEGIITKIDANTNDKLFKPGVNYLHKNFNSLFDLSHGNLLSDLIEKTFSTGKLQYTGLIHAEDSYQIRCIAVQPDQAICIITNNDGQNKMLTDMEEHNLRAIIDSYSDWLWSFDKDFNLVIANKSYLEFRQKLNQKPIVIGDKIYKNGDEAAKRKWIPIYERALNGEKINFEEKRQIEGKEYYVEIYLSPILNSRNEIIGCLGVTRDITERKLSQLAIADYANRLEEFAIKTSHELRRPIANIMGMTSLLNDKDLEDSDKDTAVDYLSTSINDLDTVVISMIELMEKNKTKAG
jgi:PAS domain S-box-containing protein